MKTASDYFNSYIGVYIVFAMNQLGILPKLSRDPQNLPNEGYSDKVDYVLRIAETLGIISLKQNKISLTEFGISLQKNIGFFTWVVGGYSDLLKELTNIENGLLTNTNSLINGKFVAVGSDECNKSLMSDIFKEAISTIHFKKVADLGCGNSGRLINLMKLNPEATGVGIDINYDAIQSAQKNVNSQKMEERISLHCANVFDELNDSSKVFKGVDTVTCFMMFHDLLNIDIGHKSLFEYLNRTFPDVETYIIADTVKNSERYDPSSIFTLGFELIHKFQDISLFDLDYYLNYFSKANLKIQKQIPFGVPNTYIFILKRI